MFYVRGRGLSSGPIFAVTGAMLGYYINLPPTNDLRKFLLVPACAMNLIVGFTFLRGLSLARPLRLGRSAIFRQRLASSGAFVMCVLPTKRANKRNVTNNSKSFCLEAFYSLDQLAHVAQRIV